MSIAHEEFEIGREIDQAVRSAAVAAGQLIERAARSRAERDRQAAARLRAQPAGTGRTAGGSGEWDDRVPVEQVLAQWQDAASSARRDPRNTGAAAAAQRLDGQLRTSWGVSPAQLLADTVQDVAAGAADRVRDDAAADLARTEQNTTAAAVGVDPAAPAGPDLQAAPAQGGPPQAAAAVPETPQAAAAAPTGERVAPAGRVVIPAGDQNPDRGVAPSRGGTPEEAQHRRTAWQMAQQAYAAQQDPGSDVAWAALPGSEQRQRFWAAYDTDQARTVSSDDPQAFTARLRATTAAPAQTPAQPDLAPVTASSRGMAPSKAPTEAERDHRAMAWTAAEHQFRADLPAGTSEQDASAAWRTLDWQDKGLRYWTAYDATGPQQPRPAAAPTEVTPPGVGTARTRVEQSSAPRPAAAVSAERVLQLNGAAEAYFAAQLQPGTAAHDYVADRVGQATLDQGRWGIGYAPAGWTNLTDHLRRGGATDTEIVGAGLGRVSSRGNVIDAFRDRVMFTVRDEQGRPVGFTGRDRSGDGRAPKYLNTGATPAYTKGEHVYGLAEAAPGAKLVRVEGPFDAIAVTAASNGASAGVSTLGTALTATQADQLAQRGPRVWLGLDNDPGGREATARDFWVLQERGIDTRELQLPDGADPAALWQQDPARLQDAVNDLDQAPSAGLSALDAEFTRRRDDLLGDGQDAQETLAHTADQIRGTAFSQADAEQVDARYTELMLDLDTTRDTGVDAGATTAGQPARDRATGEQNTETTLDASAAPDLTSTSQPSSTPAGYDRSGETDLRRVAPEARDARQVAATGFTQPTARMLATAEHRTGRAARPGPPEMGSPGLTRARRR